MVKKLEARFVPGKLGDDLEKAAKVAPRVMLALVTETVETGRTEIVKRTPVGFSRSARGGWATEVTGSITKGKIVGRIANPVLHVDPLDTGRRPGRRPPIDALIPWVGSKLGIPPGPARRSIAFLIARKIGARGTTGANMIEEGWEVAADKIKPALKAAGVKIVRTL